MPTVSPPLRPRHVSDPAESSRRSAGREADGTSLSPTALFRALAAPHRFRVRQDAEGFSLIPGRLGRIEWHDATTLAVYTDRSRLFTRLLAIPGVRRWQIGDQEVRGLMLIQACRRRTLTSEGARQKGAGTAYRGTSAA